MTLTTRDISEMLHVPQSRVQKWFAMGLTAGRHGRSLTVELGVWERWKAKNLYRTMAGGWRMKYGNSITTRPMPIVSRKQRSIAELAETYEEHPIAQVRRMLRVSAYAARVEQGQPIFGEAC